MELKVGGKFKLTKRLGQGAFGAIYSATNIKSGEEVAVKLETIKDNDNLQLQYESNLYKIF
jgi:casein kinase I family protein HRR25